jgi:hypothetical protein
LEKCVARIGKQQARHGVPPMTLVAISQANRRERSRLWGFKFVCDQCGQKQSSGLWQVENRADLGNTKTLQELSCIRWRILQYWGCETPIKHFS